jgi:MoxR-like ATPase
VVLIDEIDKAPKDFPSDILNEIEDMYFRIPELGNRLIKADKKMSPVVIITSNSEKHLPDAFLRRCVYHHIRFPDEVRMKTIVENRIRHIPAVSGTSSDVSEDFLNDSLTLFYELRQPKYNLGKKPSTAELIAFLQCLREMSDARNPIQEDPDRVIDALGVLVKTEEIEKAAEELKKWLKTMKTK